MLKRFNAKELIFIALVGALIFALIFFIGGAINAVMPGMSVFTTMLIYAIIFTITILIIKKFWTGTLLFIVIAFLALPTNMLAGLPGISKFVLALSQGITLDIIWWSTKYKKYGLYLALIVMQIVSTIVTLTFYYFLVLPGYEFSKMIKLLPMGLPVLIVIVVIGCWIGIKIYEKKLKNKRIIKQISS